MPSPQHENLVQVLTAQRSSSITSRTIEELRVGFEVLGATLPPIEGVTIEEVSVADIAVDRLAPGGQGSTVILYLHGGGYCIGSRNTHRFLAAKLALETGGSVVLPEYRLAPEHPFPAAVEDARSVYDWILGSGTSPGSVAVAGDSAGGGLAVSLQVALRDAGRPLPAASAVLSPWCDMSDLGEISDGALERDYLRPETLELFASSYLGDRDRKDPIVSPVHADLSGLGPMLVHAGTHEILFDSGRRLAERARGCGVEVVFEPGEELVHAWHMFYGGIPEAGESLERVGAFLRDHLA